MSDNEGMPVSVEPTEVEQPIPQRPERLGVLARRIGGCILGVGIAAAPIAVVEALDHASSDITIGQIEAEVSFTGNGTSSLQMGPLLKNAYINKGWHGIGATVEVTDTGNKSVTELLTARQISIYSALLNDPEAAMKSYKTVLLKEAATTALWFDAIPAVAGGLIVGLGAEVHRLRRRASGMDELSPKFMKTLWAGSVAGGLVLSTAAVYGVSRPDFVHSSPTANQRYTIERLNGTALEGAYTDNSDLKMVIERGVKKGKEYYERGQEQSDLYVANQMQQLSANRELIALPRLNERAVFLVADQHLNEAMARILNYSITVEQELSSGESPSALLGVGDYGYNMPPWLPEASYLRRIAGLSKLVDFYGVKGNHEGEYSVPVLEDGGLDFINNEVVTTDDGMSILGMDDPRTTEFLDGTTPSGQEGFDAERQVGQEAREIAEDQNPTVTLLHEAYAAMAFIGDGYDPKTFVQEGSRELTTWNEDGVPDVPTSAIAYAHWHRSDLFQPFRVMTNSDGTWSVLIELGTAGGAIGSPTAGEFSIPYEPPKQTASYPKLFIDKTSNLVTGIQIYRFYPDGTQDIGPRIDIGSIDGQPFQISQLNPSFNAKREGMARANR